MHGKKRGKLEINIHWLREWHEIVASGRKMELLGVCSIDVYQIVFTIFYVEFALTVAEVFLDCDAYDAIDPNGNVTVKWDVMSWTPDGYVAVVTIFNFQKYRHIESPGWKLGWTWAKKEVIWSMLGGQATEQGDCSRFKGNIPHCCKKNPTIVDLLPGTPYNQQIANCCKGGVISSWVQDPANAASSFQLSVGQAVTWNVTCSYSQFLAQKTPTCCVSLSAFYNDTIVGCPTCSCGCQNITQPGTCVDPDSPHIASVVSNSDKNNLAPLVQCTSHMCAVRIHWHIKINYKEYWRVKIAITNFNYRMNYTQWNLVAQHPNFDNLTQIFSFNYEPLTPYGSISK
ncbi:UNVERIFIED_CONTAM: protein COBRA [Sesamum latifolium]|uniref:Protein COBRA n=1 Tax=Sesamum latifolium TaxID=2727402 RepID=A0AAW2V0A3_9LAMI